ncbi:hypothetical protein GpartN1_g1044.t1 [Galdieria partita]|uniref:Peptidase A1 domain-containing protein n=1 Tax=Galdieria partita TaxID=83374 RepID=A0A9C7PRD2_9RHOD|nr:hypothetical protein GpartN1_g1044.t1 [Galdieria partita]
MNLPCKTVNCFLLIFLVICFEAFFKVSWALPKPALSSVLDKKAPPLKTTQFPRGVPSSMRVVDVYNNNRVSYHETNLGGGVIELGAYYSNLTLGGQEFSVLIDSGSSTLVVPMKGCVTCGDYGNFYSLEKSNYEGAHYVSCDSDACQCVTSECYFCPVSRYCSENVTSACGFYIQYGSGAIYGVEIEDLLQWDKYKVPVIFGGMLHETPDFLQAPANGILGMAYPMLSCNPNYMPPIYSVLQQRDMVQHDMFALCLGHRKGQIMVGGVNTDLADGPIEWAPFDISNPATYYRVNLGGSIRINEEVLSLPEFDVGIVDSGTTLFIVTPKAFDVIKYYFESHFCHVKGLCSFYSWFQPNNVEINYPSTIVSSCVTLTDEDVQQLPSITVTIGGKIDLTMTPDDYMYRAYDSQGNVYRCLGISTSEQGGGIQAIVGDVLLQKHLIVFDRENRQIGIAPAHDCFDSCSEHHSCSSCIRNGCAYNFETGSCASSRVLEKDSSAGWCAGFPCEVACDVL